MAERASPSPRNLSYDGAKMEFKFPQMNIPSPERQTSLGGVSRETETETETELQNYIKRDPVFRENPVGFQHLSAVRVESRCGSTDTTLGSAKKNENGNTDIEEDVGEDDNLSIISSAYQVPLGSQEDSAPPSRIQSFNNNGVSIFEETQLRLARESLAEEAQTEIMSSSQALESEVSSISKNILDTVVQNVVLPEANLDKPLPVVKQTVSNLAQAPVYQRLTSSSSFNSTPTLRRSRTILKTNPELASLIQQSVSRVPSSRQSYRNSSSSLQRSKAMKKKAGWISAFLLSGVKLRKKLRRWRIIVTRKAFGRFTRKHKRSSNVTIINASCDSLRRNRSIRSNKGRKNKFSMEALMKLQNPVNLSRLKTVSGSLNNVPSHGGVLVRKQRETSYNRDVIKQKELTNLKFEEILGNNANGTSTEKLQKLNLYLEEQQEKYKMSLEEEDKFDRGERCFSASLGLYRSNFKLETCDSADYDQSSQSEFEEMVLPFNGAPTSPRQEFRVSSPVRKGTQRRSPLSHDVDQEETDDEVIQLYKLWRNYLGTVVKRRIEMKLEIEEVTKTEVKSVTTSINSQTQSQHIQTTSLASHKETQQQDPTMKHKPRNSVLSAIIQEFEKRDYVLSDSDSRSINTDVTSINSAKTFQVSHMDAIQVPDIEVLSTNEQSSEDEFVEEVASLRIKDVSEDQLWLDRMGSISRQSSLCRLPSSVRRKKETEKTETDPHKQVAAEEDKNYKSYALINSGLGRSFSFNSEASNDRAIPTGTSSNDRQRLNKQLKRYKESRMAVMNEGVAN
ncbi:hypothetical protein LJB42_000836 [Komagataella kurtzmanii]|nr:hypothetical protein LJB42_000836 [Komagataella kurtzmanii]